MTLRRKPPAMASQPAPAPPSRTPTGTTTEYEEGIDIDQTKLNGGAPGASLTDGGIDSIDSKRLVRDPNNGCNPVWPWNFVRANSIFSVIHQAGGYAAWSDKHPAYSSVAAGLGPIALDDFYAPEINSNVIALPGRYNAHRHVLQPNPGSRLGPDRLDQQLPEHSVLRHVESQRDPQRDRREEPPRHHADPGSHHLRHELPGAERGPEAH